MKKTCVLIFLFTLLLLFAGCEQFVSVLQEETENLDSSDPNACSLLFEIDKEGRILPKAEASFPLNLLIPLEVDGEIVKTIAGCSDSGFSTLTLQGQISVDSFAFANCQGLNTVVVGEDVREIKNKAFVNCPQIMRVVINASDIEIHHSAFDCEDAEFVYLGKFYSNLEVFKTEEAGLWQ